MAKSQKGRYISCSGVCRSRPPTEKVIIRFDDSKCISWLMTQHYCVTRHLQILRLLRMIISSSSYVCGLPYQSWAFGGLAQGAVLWTKGQVISLFIMCISQCPSPTNQTSYVAKPKVKGQGKHTPFLGWERQSRMDRESGINWEPYCNLQEKGLQIPTSTRARHGWHHRQERRWVVLMHGHFESINTLIPYFPGPFGPQSYVFPLLIVTWVQRLTSLC